MLFLSLFFSAAVETAVGCAVFGGLPLFFLGGFAIAVAAVALGAVGGLRIRGPWRPFLQIRGPWRPVLWLLVAFPSFF